MRPQDTLQRSLRLAALLVPLALGLALAYAVTGLFSGGAGPSALLQTPGVQHRAAAGNSADVILKRNIMNLALPSPVDATPQQVGPPLDDPLSWAVIGIFAGENKAIAFVLTHTGTHIIKKGQDLMGWTLAEVHPKSTIWLRGEERRELSLSKDARLPQRGGPVAARAKTIKKQYKKSLFSAKVGVDKEKAEEIIKNPVILLEQALYKPYKEGDEVIGFKISNIKEDSVLKQLGVQNDDVLMSLNGEAIKDPVSLMTAYAGLEGADTISVDVLRDGKVESILVELQ